MLKYNTMCVCVILPNNRHYAYVLCTEAIRCIDAAVILEAVDMLHSIIILSHPFSTPRSLPISCSPTEPYRSLHHVFGMTYHLNSAPFLYPHHRHCQSQDIYPSPPGLPLKIKMS